MIDLHAYQIADVREAVYVGGAGRAFPGTRFLHVNPEGQGKGVEKGHRTIGADGSGAEKIAPDRLEVAAPDVLGLGPEEVAAHLAHHLADGVAGEVGGNQSDAVGAWEITRDCRVNNWGLEIVD